MIILSSCLHVHIFFSAVLEYIKKHAFYDPSSCSGIGTAHKQNNTESTFLRYKPQIWNKACLDMAFIKLYLSALFITIIQFSHFSIVLKNFIHFSYNLRGVVFKKRPKLSLRSKALKIYQFKLKMSFRSVL